MNQHPNAVTFTGPPADAKDVANAKEARAALLQLINAGAADESAPEITLVLKALDITPPANADLLQQLRTQMDLAPFDPALKAKLYTALRQAGRR